ncbi:VOC family protein [Oceanobacillus sp. FSL H7-0719]|uniref:VOC family protein n=1 Tax=Oceanobacillus sp. FSL H7-0719 TaxID=2954507 RepID=UPI0032565334
MEDGEEVIKLLKGPVFRENPILKQIGIVFIPVSNIGKAREWYCDILGIKTGGEIQFGHLYVIPMEGTGIVLESKIYSEDKIFKSPEFRSDTKNTK